ncbi:hypothetical protein Pfo_005191 [Paulownia fortunei]|nr:hypothetical protein Pfo_005191 [Paulownia fortunei]
MESLRRQQEEDEARKREEAERQKKEEAVRKAKLDEIAEKQKQSDRELEERERLRREAILGRAMDGPPRPDLPGAQPMNGHPRPELPVGTRPSDSGTAAAPAAPSPAKYVPKFLAKTKEENS